MTVLVTASRPSYDLGHEARLARLARLLSGLYAGRSIVLARNCRAVVGDGGAGLHGARRRRQDVSPERSPRSRGRAPRLLVDVLRAMQGRISPPSGDVRATKVQG